MRRRRHETSWDVRETIVRKQEVVEIEIDELMSKHRRHYCVVC